jgi:uncharacterized damage-inducible protein DinB
MSAELLTNQYALLKSSRHVLFTYCETFAPEDIHKELEDFGHCSIQKLLLHVADVYIHWLQKFALSKLTSYNDTSSVRTMDDVRRIYAQTDIYVEEFITAYSDKLGFKIEKNAVGRDTLVKTTPLTLFTHVLTHEFHHKGQIVSMSRQLGYIPVDTDMIRT